MSDFCEQIKGQSFPTTTLDQLSAQPAISENDSRIVAIAKANNVTPQQVLEQLNNIALCRAEEGEYVDLNALTDLVYQDTLKKNSATKDEFQQQSPPKAPPAQAAPADKQPAARANTPDILAMVSDGVTSSERTKIEKLIALNPQLATPEIVGKLVAIAENEVNDTYNFESLQLLQSIARYNPKAFTKEAGNKMIDLALEFRENQANYAKLSPPEMYEDLVINFQAKQSLANQTISALLKGNPAALGGTSRWEDIQTIQGQNDEWRDAYSLEDCETPNCSQVMQEVESKTTDDQKNNFINENTKKVVDTKWISYDKEALLKLIAFSKRNPEFTARIIDNLVLNAADGSANARNAIVEWVERSSDDSDYIITELIEGSEMAKGDECGLALAAIATRHPHLFNQQNGPLSQLFSLGVVGKSKYANMALLRVCYSLPAEHPQLGVIVNLLVAEAQKGNSFARDDLAAIAQRKPNLISDGALDTLFKAGIEQKTDPKNASQALFDNSYLALVLILSKLPTNSVLYENIIQRLKLKADGKPPFQRACDALIYLANTKRGCEPCKKFVEELAKKGNTAAINALKYLK